MNKTRRPIQALFFIFGSLFMQGQYSNFLHVLVEKGEIRYEGDSNK